MTGSSADAVRQEARRLAEQIVGEAAEVDAAEDAAAARQGGSDDDMPPGFADRGGRAANIKKALAELERQDAEHREVDEAQRAELAARLRRVAAGEGIPGPVPAGMDPVVWWQARIAGLERSLSELHDIEGPAAGRARSRIQQQLKRAHQALGRAEEKTAAGEVDLRGLAQRKRERRDHKARTRGGTGPTVNVTDPDSRLMTHGAGGGSVQGYNAQIAVTDDHLILGVHLSQDANDTHCFEPTLRATEHALTDLDLAVGTVLADAGYFTDHNLTLPGPDRLIAPGKNREVLTAARAAPADGAPPADAPPKEAMRHRLREPDAAELYKRRSATVETVIAHLKDQVGLRRFARRGLQAATAELNLAAAVINLRRMHTATCR